MAPSLAHLYFSLSLFLVGLLCFFVGALLASPFPRLRPLFVEYFHRQKNKPLFSSKKRLSRPFGIFVLGLRSCLFFCLGGSNFFVHWQGQPTQQWANAAQSKTKKHDQKRPQGNRGGDTGEADRFVPFFIGTFVGPER
nr:hypothetical protein [Pandoravirus massiliensis]